MDLKEKLLKESQKFNEQVSINNKLDNEISNVKEINRKISKNVDYLNRITFGKLNRENKENKPYVLN